MKLHEMFDGNNPEKLIKSIAKLMSGWSEHLHLAHTKQMHHDKNDHYRLAKTEFSKLQQRYQTGDDVTQELKDFKKEIRSSANTV